MSTEAYILLMLKHLTARSSLFLLVRTHHHLEYYFNLDDTRHAANQPSVAACLPRSAAVLEMRPGRSTRQ